MREIKPCCNILNTNLEERCLFRNTQLLKGLDIVVTHEKPGSNNYQSCIVAGIRNLHQEYNKSSSLCASMNQTESRWLLLLIM